MKMKSLFCLLFLLSILTNAQNDLSKIFKSSGNFNEIVANADQYFAQKHPGKTAKDLALGEHRDGKFVKYMRWKSFWEDHLEEDGTLGNIAKYNIKGQAYFLEKSSLGLFDAIQWTNISYNNYITGQIGLGRTTSMAFHPNNPGTFYVGAAIGGIWKTTDGGQTYVPLGDDLPFLSVSSIIVNQSTPTTIYIAISDHVWYGPPGIGVYKSTDGGNTWNPTVLTFEFTDNVRIYWMEADPNDADNIFVATANGLYRTTDGFQTVAQVDGQSCVDVKFKPGSSTTLYLGADNGKFFKSTDGGSSFSEIQDFGNGHVRIAVSPLNNQLVAAQNGSTLYQSTDSGSTFPINNASPVSNMVFAFAPTNTNIIVGGNFDIYRSDNTGSSFYAVSHWLGNSGLPLIHVDQRNVFTNPLEPNMVYFCNDGGVFRYNVALDSFEDISNGLKITQYYDIAVSQSNSMVICGGSQDNGSMYRDAAGVWDDFASTGDGMNTEIDPTNHNILYWEYQNGGMRRSSFGSNTNISPPGENGNGAWETPYRLDPTNPNRLIAGYHVVYESLDQGNNWTAISGSLAGGSDLNEIAISKSNPNRIYATHGTTLYVKATGSNTWTTKSTPATNSISDIEVDPLDMNTVYIVNSGYGAGNKIFKSSDAGDTWTNISGTLPNVAFRAIEIYEDVAGALFVGGDFGVFYIDPDFSDWEPYGDLPNTTVRDIEIQYADQLIRVGTHGRGMLEAPIDVMLCQVGDPDADMDGICDVRDNCPTLDNALIGTACDDGDPFSTGETYSTNCLCENGMANLTYCSAAGSGGTGSDWIERVAVGDLDWSSGQTFYSDFRNQSTVLVENETYTLTVNLNFSFAPDEVYGWIDFDRNSTFDPTEAIPMSAIDATHKSTGTFTVPALAQYGATTMRVRVIYADPNLADPCGNYFGEVEDYTIDLRAGTLDADGDCFVAGIDCDDTNPDINPGETETPYNGLDDDCNPATLDDDLDGDGLVFGVDCDDTVPTVVIRLIAFLEGAYDAAMGKMVSQVNTLLPLSQPFNQAPWNYTGTETIPLAPPDHIDWVLVEARHANNPDNILAQKAALLLDDGRIKDPSLDYPGVMFECLDANELYYFSIKCRNHLAVMSDQPLSATVNNLYHFSDPALVRSGSNQLVDLSGGVYGLFAGDWNSDGILSVTDYNGYIAQSSAVNQYLDADFNYNGTVTVSDFNLYLPNSSLIGVSYIRY